LYRISNSQLNQAIAICQRAGLPTGVIVSKSVAGTGQLDLYLDRSAEEQGSGSRPCSTKPTQEGHP